MKTALGLAPAFALALALTGCGEPAPEPADAPPAAETPAPAADEASAPASSGEALLEGDGFMPAQPAGGTGRKLSFGEPMNEVVGFYSTFAHEGRAAQMGRNAECGAGPLDFASWGDGFDLVFQDGEFVGWWLDEDGPEGFTTIHDIGVGSTLAELRAAYPQVEVREDSIGPEFSTGDIFGTLSGTGDDAEVTALWAGTSCIFR